MDIELQQREWYRKNQRDLNPFHEDHGLCLPILIMRSRPFAYVKSERIHGLKKKDTEQNMYNPKVQSLQAFPFLSLSRIQERS